MMLTRLTTLASALALLSALTSALPVPQQTFSLEKRDAADLDEPLEARLLFLHPKIIPTKPVECPPLKTRGDEDLERRLAFFGFKTKTQDKKAAAAHCTPSLQSRDDDEEAIAARYADEDLILSERDEETLLHVRDNLDSMLAARSDEDLILAIRELPDENFALALRSAYDNMPDVVRRGFFSKVWNGIKKGASKVYNGIKKAGAAVGQVANVAGKVVNFASSFLGKTKYGSALAGISKGINTVGAISGKAANLRRDYHDFDIEARDAVEEVMDIRSVPDEHLVLAARAVLEEMAPVERREWVSTLARYA